MANVRVSTGTWVHHVINALTRKRMSGKEWGGFPDFSFADARYT